MSPIGKYVLRNLAVSPLITALVLATMVIVGGTVGGVLSILGGLRKAFAPQGHLNRVIVTERDAEAEPGSKLPIEALARITTRPEVVRASPEVVIQSLVNLPGGGGHITLRALEPDGFEMHTAELIEGRMPTKGALEIIIGEQLKRHFPMLGIGSTITMVNERFVCVGIFRSSSYFSSEAWTSRAAFLADSNRVPLSVIYLDTAGEAEAESLAQKLRSERSFIVDAASERAFLAKVRGNHDHLVKALGLLFIFIVGGAALVAAILLSLLQQRRLSEHSVLRAIGFRAGAIAMIVLWEMQALALIGGAIGLVAVFFGLQHFDLQSTSPVGAAMSFDAQVSWTMAALCIAVMSLIATLGAIGPIVRVTRLEITRGLREE